MAEVTLGRKLAAEFIGTAVLVLGGPGTAAATFLIAKNTGVAFSMAQLGMISFAFMMIIIAMIYSIGHISGCQINPAVTVALAAAKKMPWSEVPGYVVAQFAGGIVGAFAIWGVLGKAGSDAGLGTLSYAPGNTTHAFVAELIGTLLLVVVVFATATDSRATPGWYGLAIPSYVFAIITVLAPVTGCAINPARYLGPYIVQSILIHKAASPVSQIPVYLIAEFVGALIGAALYAYLGATKPVAAERAAERVSA